MQKERLSQIWKQTAVPVILRRDGFHEKLRVRVPEGATSSRWMNALGKSHANWMVAEGGYWELPKGWFNSFVNAALDRYGKLYVIQPYREQEKCARRCMDASGHECSCSCMGRNHGAGMNASWFEVSDTFATRWHDRAIACRLMVSKSPVKASASDFDDLI